MSLALRLGYLHQQPHKELLDLCEETAKVMNGLIRSIRKSL